ncbi:MAG: hypothetical protein ACJAV9_000894, partial [Urechidicola sp.]
MGKKSSLRTCKLLNINVSLKSYSDILPAREEI